MCYFNKRIFAGTFNHYDKDFSLIRPMMMNESRDIFLFHDTKMVNAFYEERANGNERII